jgi:hypothetical protein
MWQRVPECGATAQKTPGEMRASGCRGAPKRSPSGESKDQDKCKTLVRNPRSNDSITASIRLSSGDSSAYCLLRAWMRASCRCCCSTGRRLMARSGTGDVPGLPMSGRWRPSAPPATARTPSSGRWLVFRHAASPAPCRAAPRRAACPYPSSFPATCCGYSWFLL